MNADEELILEALRAAGRLPGMDAARPQPAEIAAGIRRLVRFASLNRFRAIG